jgi:hypothetical protein
MCYDEAVRVRKLGVRGGNWTRNQVIREHMCPDCKVEMSSYTKDGVPMIKCAKCAPEGVPCSTCEPPKAK